MNGMEDVNDSLNDVHICLCFKLQPKTSVKQNSMTELPYRSDRSVSSTTMSVIDRSVSCDHFHLSWSAPTLASSHPLRGCQMSGESYGQYV